MNSDRHSISENDGKVENFSRQACTIKVSRNQLYSAVSYSSRELSRDIRCLSINKYTSYGMLLCDLDMENFQLFTV